MKEKEYYNLLFNRFGSFEEIFTELINLEAILQLPKGTEHYISDIHGEHEAFAHTLKNGAGLIREKVYLLFPKKTTSEKEQLALFIYYPEKFIQKNQPFNNTWYFEKANELIIILKEVAGKYSRSKLRKALPKNFAYLAEELIFRFEIKDLKKDYYLTIVNKLIQLDQMENFLIDMCKTIQRLVVDHLHVVGDIFDRGAHADKVMDELMQHHNVDIQWGNHDILWLGAMSGSKICLVNLLRISARYNYLENIEEAYGINMRQLYSFSEKNYIINKAFNPKNCPDPLKTEQLNKIQQALTILQFKLEGQLSERRPEFYLSSGNYLNVLSPSKDYININNEKHTIINGCFQTVNSTHPNMLTDEENELLQQLLDSFQHSHRMQQQLDFLMKKGSMYLVYNQQLLFHGCIPLTTTGEFQSVSFNGQDYAGKSLLDFFDISLRKSFYSPDIQDDFFTDLYWYAWCGKYSPLYGKEKMATFERYFLEDNSLKIEKGNPYFDLRSQKSYCEKILKEFNLENHGSHIINGHTPIKVQQGESPIKAEGKLFVIDGGLSKAYQKTTGIAGYTLLYTSTGFQIVTHQPFNSIGSLFEQHESSVSNKRVINKEDFRILIKDTSIGTELKQQIRDLEQLLKTHPIEY